MKWEITRTKCAVSIIFGLLFGAILGLREVCAGACAAEGTAFLGFAYSLDNNSILAALIFAIPFIILIYLVYSLLQHENHGRPLVTVIKSKSLNLNKHKHQFGWRDLKKEMLWESVLEAVILLGAIALVILYLVLYVFGDKPKPELGWMFWAILGLLVAVLIAAVFYVIIFTRYLKLGRKK